MLLIPQFTLPWLIWKASGLQITHGSRLCSNVLPRCSCQASSMKLFPSLIVKNVHTELPTGPSIPWELHRADCFFGSLNTRSSQTKGFVINNFFFGLVSFFLSFSPPLFPPSPLFFLIIVVFLFYLFVLCA